MQPSRRNVLAASYRLQPALLKPSQRFAAGPSLSRVRERGFSRLPAAI